MMRSSSMFTLVVLLTPAAYAQEQAPSRARLAPAVTSLRDTAPKTALFVGHSFFYYNNSLHHFVDGLEKAGDPDNAKEYRNTSATISGAGLDWHDVDSYFKPEVGAYSFVGKEIRFNTVKKPFDVVIMTDCGQCPFHPKLRDTFFEYAKKHSDTVRKHGAAPVLFMTWAYAGMPEMTVPLAEAYTRAGNESQALVVPAGLAFEKALQRRPSLVLHAPDTRHPSVAGSYLAACTIYAAVQGKSPVGSSYTGGVDKEVARFLQEVAWETVQEYFGRSRS